MERKDRAIVLRSLCDARRDPLADSCGDGTVVGKGGCFSVGERGADMLNARMARQLARWIVPIGAAAVCTVVLLARPSATTVRAAPVDEAVATPPSTRPVADLAKERIATAADGFRLAQQGYAQGQRSFDELGTWSRRQAEAALDPSVPAAQRVELLEQHVKQSQEVERVAAMRHRAGLGGQDEAIGAKYLRLEAEIWLARARENGQPNRPGGQDGR
jgi:hypothetical protein